MAEVLFDLSDEYEAMLNRGISLSGEHRDFFAMGRIDDLRKQLPGNKPPRRILDFGCGTGDTARRLAEAFPGAEVVGIDTAEPALAVARTQYASDRLQFQSVEGFNETGKFDLCYVNGVFHHIEPEDRIAAVGLIYRALAAGGILALFENNPWNPGTRLVMHRIPFDRDAKPLSPPEAKRLVHSVGFQAYARSRFLFYFPRTLAWFRPLERLLVHIPLGAQYCVLGMKA